MSANSDINFGGSGKGIYLSRSGLGPRASLTTRLNVNWVDIANSSDWNGVTLAASGGNVLIGTTTDAGFKLDVNGTGRFNGSLIFNSSFSTYTADGLFNANSRPSRLRTPSGGEKVLFGYWDGGSGQYYGRIGFVGSTNWSIGTASNNTSLLISTGNGGALGVGMELASTGAATFSSSISAGGDVIAFSSSDRRLKNNITSIKNPLQKINKIGGYSFTWNSNQDTYSGNDYGVVAQEIEEILPEIVTTRDSGYKAVKYEKLVPLLIEAIKELSKEVEILKRK
jgi:hypothetical protein